MKRRPLALLVVAALLGLLGSLMYLQYLAAFPGRGGTIGLINQQRLFSYLVAAPKGWPIIHDTRFNGRQVYPETFRTDYWIDEITMGGSGIAGLIPLKFWNRHRISVTSRWIEWKTGKAYSATLIQDLDPDWGSAIVRFQRDGALSLYRRSDALLAGSLGRPANLNDYIEIARVCGTPLENRADLEQARARNDGIYFDTFDPDAWPAAEPSFCSE